MMSDKIDLRPSYGGGCKPLCPPGPPGPSLYSRPSSWHKEKPFRPPYFHSRPHSQKYESLNKYEAVFDQQFLDPPKPGGFGHSRHWPVSYLHKEGPPNATADIIDVGYNRRIIEKPKLSDSTEEDRKPNGNPKGNNRRISSTRKGDNRRIGDNQALEDSQGLEDSPRLEDKKNRRLESERRIDEKNKYKSLNTMVEDIKSDKRKNLEYTTGNNTSSSKSSEEEILLVRIPMPEAKSKEEKVVKLEVIDTKNSTKRKNSDKTYDFEELFLISVPKNRNKNESVTIRTPKRDLKIFPVVRRGYVTRTNLSSIRRKRLRPDKDHT